MNSTLGLFLTLAVGLVCMNLFGLFGLVLGVAICLAVGWLCILGGMRDWRRQACQLFRHGS